MKKQLDLLNKKQVADLLGVSKGTVENYVRQGKIQQVKFADTRQGKVMFHRNEIERFVKELTMPPTKTTYTQ